MSCSANCQCHDCFISLVHRATARRRASVDSATQGPPQMPDLSKRRSSLAHLAHSRHQLQMHAKVPTPAPHSVSFYAGPTFHNSPEAGTLPIPAFVRPPPGLPIPPHARGYRYVSERTGRATSPDQLSRSRSPSPDGEPDLSLLSLDLQRVLQL